MQKFCVLVIALVVEILKKLYKYAKDGLKPLFESITICSRNYFNEHLYIAGEGLAIHIL